MNPDEWEDPAWAEWVIQQTSGRNDTETEE